MLQKQLCQTSCFHLCFLCFPCFTMSNIFILPFFPPFANPQPLPQAAPRMQKQWQTLTDPEDVRRSDELSRLQATHQLGADAEQALWGDKTRRPGRMVGVKKGGKTRRSKNLRAFRYTQKIPNTMNKLRYGKTMRNTMVFISQKLGFWRCF